MEMRTGARLLATGIAAAAATVAGVAIPNTAAAAYLIRESETAKSETFDSGEECGPAAVALKLPRGARRVRVINGPGRGERLFGPGASDARVGVITGVRVRPGGRNEVLWGAKPLSNGCKPRYGEPIDVDENGNDVFGPPKYFSWISEEYEFEARYLIRDPVRLSRSRAASLASTALSRRFGQAYNLAEGYPRCRRPRRNRARCSISFFQGDGYWVGSVNVRVGTTRNHRKLRWGYRLNVLQVDDYCDQVLNRPLSACSHRYRKSRNRLPVPGGRL